MRIGNQEIGLNHPPYIIAEIGVNHDGDVNRALELTDAAAEAGADAIKLQFFETDRLMSKAAKLAAYQKAAGETDPIEMLRRLELTIDEMALVVERAHSKGIHAIVTVFSTELVPIAETLPWDAYKTASPDIINKPLLEGLMHTGKPMVVSTGASTMNEVIQAVNWLESTWDQLAVLQCVSSYPTRIRDANVGACMEIKGHIDAIPEDITHDFPIGYSDHTTALNTGLMARLFLASIFEKHLTDDQTRKGPDHKASLDSNQLHKYIEITRINEDSDIPTHLVNTDAYGSGKKQVLDCEKDVRLVARQSVVSTQDIPTGTTITLNMLTIKRPGTGIPPYKLNQILGSKTSQPIEADTPITESDLI